MNETLLTPNADIEPNFFPRIRLAVDVYGRQEKKKRKKSYFAGTLSLGGLGHGRS